MFIDHQSLPAWEVLRPDDVSVPIGSKRSHDYSVDDFFTDMKKRRVNPSYDPREFLPTPACRKILTVSCRNGGTSE